ncbi:hypothetical protein EVAR_48983_1 [Eumeta japonica]|uniref:Uncharacterized protein n=1 Tax=Eumeta variegata TaxID=151549 RepID=A0A4C1Z151_EUMVA|nr:hypothetical protein EVAR_48983_1 [Eumeta japonica]
MSPHMMAMAVCRLQRREAPPSPTEAPLEDTSSTAPDTTTLSEGSTELPDEQMPPPEISLYSDQQVILDEAGWAPRFCTLLKRYFDTHSLPSPGVGVEDHPAVRVRAEHLLSVAEVGQTLLLRPMTILLCARLSDIVVVEGGSPYAEGWGLITLAPNTLSDTKTIARLLAQQDLLEYTCMKDPNFDEVLTHIPQKGTYRSPEIQNEIIQATVQALRSSIVNDINESDWFGGLVSPRWWSSQWLLEALTSVLGERAPPLGDVGAEKQEDALLLHHMLPALRSGVHSRPKSRGHKL